MVFTLLVWVPSQVYDLMAAKQMEKCKSISFCKKKKIKNNIASQKNVSKMLANRLILTTQTVFGWTVWAS